MSVSHLFGVAGLPMIPEIKHDTNSKHGVRFSNELTSACKNKELRESDNEYSDVCVWLDNNITLDSLNKLSEGRKFLIFAHDTSLASQIDGCEWLDRCVLVTDIQTLNRNGFEIHTAQYAFERQVDELLKQLSAIEFPLAKPLRTLKALVVWLSTGAVAVISFEEECLNGILAYAPNMYAFAERPLDVLKHKDKSILFIRAMTAFTERLFEEAPFGEADVLDLCSHHVYYIAPGVHDALLLFALAQDTNGTYKPQADNKILIDQINADYFCNQDDKEAMTNIITFLRENGSLFTHPVHIPLYPPNNKEFAEWSMYACLGIDGFDIGRRIMSRGADSVKGLPMLKRGRFRSFDHKETMSILNIERLIEEYCAGNDTNPLSIAILGAPGAGKSFFLNELVDGLNRKEGKNKISRHTINLSQLSYSDDSPLNDAFQKIRDESLEGWMPLLFVDEFDTDDYRWLIRFLTPMQDGQFIVGSSIHRLPRCILVFAGGVSRSLADMLESNDAVKRKIPDFISRLHATQTVWGVDRDSLDTHRMYIARRAIILKQGINRKNKDAYFDDALQYALLNLKSFTHGARSIARFCNALTLDGDIIGKSCLPTDDVLKQYFDTNDFWNMYRKGRALMGIKEAYGKKTHETYETKQRNHISKFSKPITCGYASKKWDDLNDFEKDMNYDSLWHIEQIISRYKYSICDDRISSLLISEEAIVKMARDEHMRWTSTCLMNGIYFGYGINRKPSMVDCDTLEKIKTVKDGESSFELDKSIIVLQLKEYDRIRNQKAW